MRARPNVDAGTPLPDRLTRLAGTHRARPRDGTFRELRADILPELKSTRRVPVFNTSINGSGRRDGKTHVAANVTGETHGRRRHVPSPARRLRKRPGFRLVVHERRLFLVIEEGRLGFFVTCRGGIDAGHVWVDGMQHTRRISIQRGHAQAPLAGRTNEL